MDRHRFSQRKIDITNCAKLIEDLSRMPDRATEKDLKQAAELMRGAACDLSELFNADLPGCVCRRIDHDNYSYLDYTESCRHHASLYKQQENLKANNTKMEKALKNEARMMLVASALTGTACMAPQDLAGFANNAIAIADEGIARLTEAP